MNVHDLPLAPRRHNRGITILGLDLSVDRTGCATWELDRAPASMKTQSIITKTLAKQRGLFQIDAFFEVFLEILLDVRPDFLAIEEPRKDIQMFTTASGQRVPNPGSTLPVNQFYGAARAAIRSYVRETGQRLPFETVPVNTWRKAVYGFGTKKGWETKHWKEEARNRARNHLGLLVSNGDEAEAVMIALYAKAEMQTLKELMNAREAA